MMLPLRVRFKLNLAPNLSMVTRLLLIDERTDTNGASENSYSKDEF